MKYIYVLTLQLLLCFTLSCNKDSTPPTPPKVIDTKGVYVAGYQKLPTIWNPVDAKTVAKYWKDGVPVVLTDSTKSAAITDIYVTNNAVYCCGYEQNSNGESIAKYWINGVGRELPDGKIARSIDVTDGIITITGESDISYNGTKFRVWLNGGQFTAILSANAIYDGCSKGGVPYIIGRSIMPSTSKMCAAYWVNVTSNPTFVANGEDLNPIKVKFSGNDMYMCMQRILRNPQDSSQMQIWKNGVLTNFSNGVLLDYPYDFTIDGNDVYVAGQTTRKFLIPGIGYEYEVRPAYWKNGQSFQLPIPNVIPYPYGIGTGIGLQDKDVFVCGYTGGNTNINTAVYWKNGVLTNLTDGSTDAQALSIFVKN